MSSIANPLNAIDALTRLPADQMRFLLGAARRLDAQTILSQSIDAELSGADEAEIDQAIIRRNSQLLMDRAGGDQLKTSVVSNLVDRVEEDIVMSDIHGDEPRGVGYCSTGN